MVLVQGFRDSSLLFKGFSSLGSVVLVGLSLGLSDGFGIGVQFIHELLVVQGVLHLSLMGNIVGLGGSDNGLDFVRIDDSGDVGVGEDGSLQLEVALLVAGLSERTEHVVEGLDGGGSPDTESTELSTGGKGLQIQTVNISGFDTGDVSESLHESHVFVGVHDQRSLLLLISFISDFSSTGGDGLGVNHLLDVFVSAESLQESNGLVGLLERFKSVFDDKGHFGHLRHLVSSGLDEGGKGGGGQSSGNGVSSLFEIHFSVPSSVVLEGEGHSSLSHHVTEGGLAGSGSTRSGNSGNSGSGTSGTPGFGRVFHTGFGVNSVSLSSVLGQVGVHKLNDIQTDGGLENSGHSHFGFSNLSRIVNVEDR